MKEDGRMEGWNRVREEGRKEKGRVLGEVRREGGSDERRNDEMKNG